MYIQVQEATRSLDNAVAASSVFIRPEEGTTHLVNFIHVASLFSAQQDFE